MSKRQTAQKSKKAKRQKPTKAEQEAATIKKAEENLVAKHGGRIVKGTVRRAKTKAEKETYGNKLLVDINTVGVDGKPDGNRLTVATSDVHQVQHTPEVKAQLRRLQRSESKGEKVTVK
ncbi:MAG: hypothetical protein GF364_19240 [Candidatus Lokiarchaeota archaeon]|nr:hypothetical protein [Candidatus Lokiarchaeota archaeon]